MINVKFLRSSIFARSVKSNFDLLPSAHHKFQTKLLKKWIIGKSVLDIGCWTGQILSLMQNEAQCTGIDIDKNAIGFAKKHRKGIYIVGSALKLPFKEEMFDVVIMSHVLEHLPPGTEGRAIGNAARVIKKQGLFAISVPASHPLSVIFDPAFFLLKHRHYSEKELSAILTTHGFKIKRVIHYGNFRTLIIENLHLVNKHIFNLATLTKFIDSLSVNRFRENGFAAVHILAQKI